MVPYPSNLSGGANRRSPTGGFAYGIPKYPETSEPLLALPPMTLPLEVLTDCPIFQFDWNATAHIPFMSNNVKILSFMLIEKAKNIMLTGLFVQDVNSIFG